MICLECQKDCSNLRGLHIHLKIHGGQSAYYEKWFPRKDFFCNEKINYKDHEEYFSTFFLSKATRNLFYKSKSTEEVQMSILEEFFANKRTKDLKVFPSSTFFELAGLFTVEDIKKAFGSISYFCKRAGIKQVFTKETPKDFWIAHAEDVNILIDTREKTPFGFKNSEAQKLSIGDYVAIENHFSKLAIDRKSIADYQLSFCRDFERIRDNIIVAKDMGWKLYYIVEGLPCQMEADEKRYKRGTKLKYIFSNTRKILEEFPETTQIIFCLNRIKAQDLTQRLLFFGEKIFNCDIQYFNK